MKLTEISPKYVTIAAAGVALILVSALVLGLVNLLFEPEEVPKVASTTPQDGASDVLTFTPAIVTFQEDLSEERQQNVSVDIQPSANISPQWVGANRLQLSPTEFLLEDTAYTISLSYKDKEIHSFSFRTTQTSQKELTEDILFQTQADYDFSQALTEFLQDNPWYAQMPIVTDSYTIVYDFEKESFRIRITLGEDASNVQVGAAQQNALNDLREIGVDTNTENYHFIVE